MKTRCLRHCIGGCGRTSVASKEWICWNCEHEREENEAIKAVQKVMNEPSPIERLLMETNHLLNELLMLHKERM